MTHSLSFVLFHLFFFVYVGCFVCINLVAFLWSDFYRKRINQPSPRLGFLVSMGCGVLLMISVFAGHKYSIIETLQPFLLLGCAVITIYGSMSLFFTMKKKRK